MIPRVNGMRFAGSVLLMNMTSRLDPIVRANSAPSIVSAAMCFYMVLLQFSWEIDVPCEAAVAQVHAQ
jgi:hypothetical protein